MKNKPSITNIRDYKQLKNSGYFNTLKPATKYCSFEDDDIPTNSTDLFRYRAERSVVIRDQKVIRALLEEAQKDRDGVAFNILIEANLLLIYFIKNKYFAQIERENPAYTDDLYQTGLIGLCQAIEKFDLNYYKPVSFSTFAWQCITHSILNFVSTIVVPINYQCHDKQLLHDVSFTELLNLIQSFDNNSWFERQMNGYSKAVQEKIQNYLNKIKYVKVISYEDKIDEVNEFIETNTEGLYAADINTAQTEAYINLKTFATSIFRTKVNSKRLQAYYKYDMLFGEGLDISYEDRRYRPKETIGISAGHAGALRNQLLYFMEEDENFEVIRMLFLDYDSLGGKYEKF